MPQPGQYWTKERISWLEQKLAAQRDNTYAVALLAWLSQLQTIEEKRTLIVEKVISAMRQEANAPHWSSQEASMRLALREILQGLLYREHVIERVPTNERDMPDERSERERLARLFSGGESLSEMVVEDRGPR